MTRLALVLLLLLAAACSSRSDGADGTTGITTGAGEASFLICFGFCASRTGPPLAIVSTSRPTPAPVAAPKSRVP